MKRALAYIRQLCCLGLGGEAVMPALFQAIHDLIPAASKTFLWTGEDCHITHMYQVPGTPQLTALYLEEFYQKRELEAWPGAEGVMRHAANVDWTLRGIDKKRFYRSEFYAACWRSRESHDPIHARIYNNGLGVGTLLLSRGQKDKPFTQEDVDRLKQLVPYISHAMERRPDFNPRLVECGEEGLVVLDQAGRVLYLSQRAKDLLAHAAPSRPPPRGIATGHGETSMTPVLTELVKHLIAVFTGKETAPPVFLQQNSWGRFVFRAQWLVPPAAADEPAKTPVCEIPEKALVGITIQHHAPVALTLLRAMRTLPLSTREKEVCVLLGEGFTHNEIAKHLRIRPSSVVTYVRSLYEKLDVHSHEELIQRLQGQRVPVWSQDPG